MCVCACGEGGGGEGGRRGSTHIMCAKHSVQCVRMRVRQAIINCVESACTSECVWWSRCARAQATVCIESVCTGAWNSQSHTYEYLIAEPFSKSSLHFGVEFSAFVEQ